MKSELIIDITVRATNTRKYKEVTMGTWELRFDASGQDVRHVLKIDNEVGMSDKLNPVFLESINIQPNMRERTE